MKDLIFAPRAETSLVEINEWTVERFGVVQAQDYSDELLTRCWRLAAGDLPHQSFRAVFADDIRADLRFVRAGRHFVIFVETAVQVRVIDFVHQSSDVGRRLRDL